MGKYLVWCLEKKNGPKKEKIRFTEPTFAYFVLCSQVVLGVLQAHSHLFSVIALQGKRCDSI